MAYDLHAFGKVFIGTQLTANNANVNLSDGFVITAGLGTDILAQTSSTVNSNYGVGTFGMFNSTTWKSVTSSGITACCPLILASASLYANDKVSPFIGGYQESNKSKMINPKLITNFYRVDPCTPQQQILHIGNTKYTKTLSPTNAACCFAFNCGETYTLRIDIKGSPALRFLNHQLYRNIDFFTGCCPGPAITLVDSTLVMIGWANAIVTDPLMAQFISPIVYSEAGTALFPPGTAGQTTWDTYVSPGHVTGKCAGLRVLGAYVDTRFKDCTFQTTDFFEKEPIKIFVSMIDFNGDPCAFTGICTITECPALQGMGFGEQVLRDLILSERYRQFDFNSDFRIREITQGDQEISAISRTAFFFRYVILHNIPRYNNPTSTYDNDRYRLEIITTKINTSFESFMNTWLGTCTNCVSLSTNSCSPCTPLTP